MCGTRRAGCTAGGIRRPGPFGAGRSDEDRATRRSDIQASITEQSDAARTSESGVSLDEEMTNLLSYQRAYEAASRVISTVDSVLDVLINRMAV